MKRMTMVLICIAMSWLGGTDASACSCYWQGSFLEMARKSELVIRAKVLRHFGESKGQARAMELEVLEVFFGEEPGNHLQVWGGDGLVCRPDVAKFPVGTEWVLALDGPGSKPGMSPGRTISICGEFWLQVQNGKVIGCIDAADMNIKQELELGVFRERMAAALEPMFAARRNEVIFSAEIRSQETFEHAFGPALLFRLEPSAQGWTVVVRQAGRDEDLSRLTPPLHSLLNPRDIEGWQFRNIDNTGPNMPGNKNINAPGLVRSFIFSPEVGASIDGPAANSAVTPDLIEKVRAYGRGQLRILEYKLNHLEPGKKAGIEKLRFEVKLSWPKSRQN